MARRQIWFSHIINFYLHGVAPTKPVTSDAAKDMQIISIHCGFNGLANGCATSLKGNRIDHPTAIIEAARKMRPIAANTPG